MDQQPRLVVVDFETVELNDDGTVSPSLDFYKSNFRASECAVGYRDHTNEVCVRFAKGEPAIKKLLQEFTGDKIVAHNLPFDSGVARCRFPDVKLQWYADTMRMAQVFDNGGDGEYEMQYIPGKDGSTDDAKKVSITGYGLVKCMRRIMNAPDHKKEAYDWLRQNTDAKKGTEGQYLYLLPDDVMQRYNEGDVKATLKLYEYLEEKFLEWDYNWRFDHELFLALAHEVVKAQIKGVRVDRDQLKVSINSLQQEIREIEQKFETTFAGPIRLIEQAALKKKLDSYKSDRPKTKLLNRIQQDQQYWKDTFGFNTGSNKQLLELFMVQLKIEPKFFTQNGAPSFKGSVIDQWGEGGKMLKMRRKRLIVLKQCEALLAGSEYDGRMHFSLKVVATKTGRGAGGSH